ncbi:PRELI domain-containing protein 2-like [Macrobrachium rosenbergii]|uniref:PRELI domain-containing protein 2-like n=1 Tax=Macrobrachium rosenbergii TaxID=79674 RepID=UPI0034D61C26
MTVTITAEHVYKEPVEVVAATHLAKFPNDHDPNIVVCNTVERSKTTDGRNYTKRVALVRNVLPSVLRRTKSLQVDHFEMEEECWWDKKKREFQVQSENRSVKDWIDMREHSVYLPHKQNANWTQFDQVGTLTVKGLGRIGTVIEIFGQKFLSVGAQRGIKITEALMAEKSKRLTSLWYSEFLFA